MQFETPILLIAFNRVDTAKKVFDEVRKQKPKHLYIAADGPRKDRPDDISKCENVRKIYEDIDWDCNVHKLYKESNLGCHTAVPDAISWFFQNVSKGIILEDDCLPNPTFFRYCEDLLEQHKNNENIMMISGDNFMEKTETDQSYFYSKYAFIWGWATWKRAWSKFDKRMATYPSLKASGYFNKILPGFAERFFWKTAFDNKYSGKKEGWDTKWCYALMANKGLSITPKVNLITNIGFTSDATTTNTENSKGFVLPTHDLEFPLRPNEKYEPNATYDKVSFKQVFMSTVSCRMILLNYFPALKKIWSR